MSAANAGLVLLHDLGGFRFGHGGTPCNISSEDGWCYDHKSYNCPRDEQDLPIGCQGYHRDEKCLTPETYAGFTGMSPKSSHHHHDQRCTIIFTPDCVVEGCTRVSWRDLGAGGFGLCPEHLRDRGSYGAGTVHTAHGVALQADDRIEYGSLVWSEIRLCWVGSSATSEQIMQMHTTKRLALMQSLRTGKDGGITVVRAVVKNNVRRAPTSSYTVSDLSPLVQRAEHLVIQIASRDDWEPGARDQLLKSYAAIVDELNAVREQMDEVDTHLSVVRGQLMDFAISGSG